MNTTPLLSVRHIHKYFGSMIALQDINLEVNPSQVVCLLGDNGAGKSTLIKILSGVYQPDKGNLYFNDKLVHFHSTKDALDLGIATVYQDLAMVPLMSITRNFFLGRENLICKAHTKKIDWEKAFEITTSALQEIGITLRSPIQMISTLSGGERQCVAIARALYFGAKVLILDEPTSALGVRQSELVIQCIHRARAQGIGVIFITHNIHHAYEVGNRFVLLRRGHALGSFTPANISKDALFHAMSGSETAASI